ncbi:alpha-amylase family glycosyl hydrolase [Candidatus Neomarinimicrobiota bacterium]
MRKTAFIIGLIFLFSCSQKEVGKISDFPTIILQTGVEQNIDLTKYISNIDKVIVGKTDGVSAKYSSESKILKLTADGNKALITLPLKINKNDIELLLWVNPMVEHTFTFTPNKEVSSIVVMGQFNDWSRTALPLFDEDNDGVYKRKVFLKPQKHEYKFVVDGVELIDPANSVLISNNIGGWNSILELTEFKSEAGGRIIKEKWEKGLLTYYYKPIDDTSDLKELILIHNNSIVDEEVYSIDENNLISVEYMKLGDGTLRIAGIDEKDRVIAENITIIKNSKVLNPTDHPNDWHFAVLYNLMVDRFLDGDLKNTWHIQTNDLYELANFHGGDLMGIIQKLEEGYFTNLGINSIWLSPLNRQPDSAYVEWIPPHRKFTGYHGYWPIAPRKIDPRYGTEEKLKELVKIAHSKNIKVILDFVSNHVHEEHPYFKEHRDWFGNMELSNGEINIRNWSEETRLTTWFDEFIPSFDFPSAPEVIDQVVDDAIWWLETFDLDGFRQDAVKHVPHTFWKQLTAKMKLKFPNKQLYQIGETFGSDRLILDYVNPGELDAQFNFAIYFNARSQFALNNSDFIGLKDVLDINLNTYHPVNLMGNITSSHDQLRFIGIADGQVSWSDDGTERTFNNPPIAVQNESSYSKLANFHAFNITIPGVPVVYYGEEIGLMGSGDPGNRRPMRFGDYITNSERELLFKIRKLNELRSKYPALAVGDLEILKANGPLLIIQKSYFGEKIIVAINNGSIEQSIESEIQYGKLKNLLIDNIKFINDRKFELNIPPYSYSFYKLL